MNDTKWRQKNGRCAKAESSSLYLVLDEIIITIDDIQRAVDNNVQNSSESGFASRSVELFKESNIQIF